MERWSRAALDWCRLHTFAWWRLLLFRQVQRWLVCQRLAFRSWWMVAPRGVYEQLGRHFRTELSQGLFLQQNFPVIAVVEKLRHRKTHQQRVFHGPDVRSVGH